MPHKFNENCRRKIKQLRYRVTNWHTYNDALRHRGDITIWFTEEAIVVWHPAKRDVANRRNIPSGNRDGWILRSVSFSITSNRGLYDVNCPHNAC